jgi:integrase
VDADGRRDDRYFESEEDAKQFIRALKKKLQKLNAKPLEMALEEYRVYLRDDKGNKAKSVAHTIDQLGRFFGGMAGTVDEFEDEAACAARYDVLRQHKKKNGALLSVDTHRNALAETKTFLNWCGTKGYLKTNGLMTVKGTGKRRYGKPQLYIDEARAWSATALNLAAMGDGDEVKEGALKALMALHLGLRVSEILLRQVRDVDDRGGMLWIPDSKTAAGRRRVEVPGFLRPLLLQMAEGRPGSEFLFKYRTVSVVRNWVKRICIKAGVPKVSAHAMRGLHGTLAVDAGATSHLVASAMGHESFTTTATSYAKRESVEGAKHRKALQALTLPSDPEEASEESKLHNLLHNESIVTRRAS